MKNACAFVMGVLVALLAAPGISAAQGVEVGVGGAAGGGTIEPGTLRLHLQTGVIQYQNGEYDPDGPGDIDFDGFNIGIGQKGNDYLRITGGQPLFGLGVGFVVIPGLTIGGIVGMGYTGTEEENLDAGFFNFALIPYGEYAFLDGPIRPFAMVTMGVVGTVGETEFGSWGNDSDIWYAMFHIGAGGGAHFFLGPQFSIDLIGLFSFNIGGGEEDPSGGPDEDVDIHAFEIDILAGISVWL